MIPPNTPQKTRLSWTLPDPVRRTGFYARDWAAAPQYGARGLLLIALACLVSGIASFVLLSRQRDVMSSALMARDKAGCACAPPTYGRSRTHSTCFSSEVVFPGAVK